MQLPKRLNAEKVIEKYGRKVELVKFGIDDETRIHGVRVDEWLLFSSDKTPVILFPLTPDGKVVAIEQFRYGANEVVLELPGGLEENKETWVETAERELLEETGCKGQEYYITGCPIWFDPCCYNEKFMPVFVKGCRKVAEPTAEHCKVVLCDLHDWYRACAGGTLVDSKSLAVSLLMLPKLNQRLGCLAAMTQAQ